MFSKYDSLFSKYHSLFSSYHSQKFACGNFVALGSFLDESQYTMIPFLSICTSCASSKSLPSGALLYLLSSHLHAAPFS